MRYVALLFELLGIAAIVAGVAMWSVAAAWVVGGVLALAVGFLLEPDA